MQSLRLMRHKLSKTKARLPIIWYYHLGIRPGDVFAASYPRSGNTWFRFLLYELLSGKPANFETINLPTSPAPDINNYRHSPGLLPDEGRLIKTHEPFRPKYRKAIYIVRDVRDVVLSEYNYLRLFNFYHGSFEEFLPLFLAGKANGYGSWNEHVASWCQSDLAQNGNMLLIKFEEMRQNTADVLKRALAFLQLSRTEEQIALAIANNSLANMKQKEQAARHTVYAHLRQDINFVRQGKSGGWQQKLSQAQVDLIEKYAQPSLVAMGYPLSK